jgi:hypothetical protein
MLRNGRTITQIALPECISTAEVYGNVDAALQVLDSKTVTEAFTKLKIYIEYSYSGGNDG